MAIFRPRSLLTRLVSHSRFKVIQNVRGPLTNVGLSDVTVTLGTAGVPLVYPGMGRQHAATKERRGYVLDDVVRD